MYACLLNKVCQNNGKVVKYSNSVNDNKIASCDFGIENIIDLYEKTDDYRKDIEYISSIGR